MSYRSRVIRSLRLIGSTLSSTIWRVRVKWGPINRFLASFTKCNCQREWPASFRDPKQTLRNIKRPRSGWTKTCTWSLQYVIRLGKWIKKKSRRMSWSFQHSLTSLWASEHKVHFSYKSILCRKAESRISISRSEKIRAIGMKTIINKKNSHRLVWTTGALPKPSALAVTCSKTQNPATSADAKPSSAW